MNHPWKNLRRVLVCLTLAVVLVAATANVASAQQINYHRLSHYHSPIPTGPTYTQYSPATSSYYSVPVIRPVGLSPQPFVPLVHTQRYSFYQSPVVNVYPPTFTSYQPAFPAANAYYQTNLLAPYVHSSAYPGNLAPYVYGNTLFQTTSPYQTPLFFRY